MKRNARLFQRVLVDGDVAAITPKAVYLPDNDGIEEALLRVVYHPQELVAAFRGLAGDVVVCVYAYHTEAMRLGVSRAVRHLALDGLVCLMRAGGVARIDYRLCSMISPLLVIRSGFVVFLHDVISPSFPS